MFRSPLTRLIGSLGLQILKISEKGEVSSGLREDCCWCLHVFAEGKTPIRVEEIRSTPLCKVTNGFKPQQGPKEVAVALADDFNPKIRIL